MEFIIRCTGIRERHSATVPGLAETGTARIQSHCALAPGGLEAGTGPAAEGRRRSLPSVCLAVVRLDSSLGLLLVCLLTGVPCSPPPCPQARPVCSVLSLSLCTHSATHALPWPFSPHGLPRDTPSLGLAILSVVSNLKNKLRTRIWSYSSLLIGQCHQILGSLWLTALG